MSFEVVNKICNWLELRPKNHITFSTLAQHFIAVKHPNQQFEMLYIWLAMCISVLYTFKHKMWNVQSYSVSTWKELASESWLNAIFTRKEKYLFRLCAIKFRCVKASLLLYSPDALRIYNNSIRFSHQHSYSTLIGTNNCLVLYMFLLLWSHFRCGAE